SKWQWLSTRRRPAAGTSGAGAKRLFLDIAREYPAWRWQSGAGNQPADGAEIGKGAPVDGHAKLIEDASRRTRHYGLQKDRQMSVRFREHVKNARHALGVGFAQGPGRLFINVSVGGRHYGPDRIKDAVECLFGQIAADLPKQRFGGGQETVIRILQRTW